MRSVLDVSSTCGWDGVDVVSVDNRTIVFRNRTQTQKIVDAVLFVTGTVSGGTRRFPTIKETEELVFRLHATNSFQMLRNLTDNRNVRDGLC